MKIVVLATESGSTWMVVNALRVTYPDLRVALERPVSRWGLLAKRMRKQGALCVMGQLLFMLCVPILRWRSQSRIAGLVTAAGLSVERPTGLAVAEFESANSNACQVWLRDQAPDVVVVNGTRILSSSTLTTCQAVFLNTHCGITPAYRGVHGAYWALAQGDVANAGVTVHVVDPGIDTGDIVYQRMIEVDQRDNFLTYPVHQYASGVPLLLRAIHDISHGQLKTYQRSDLQSAIWYHPTLWRYLWTRMWRRVR